MAWLIDNKEWLFSGVAIAIPVAFIGFIFSGRSIRQSQRGGGKSTNIQIGGDVKINKE